MKKTLKPIFWILLLIGTIGSSPILLERYKTEKANNTYQIALDYQSISNIKNKEQRETLYKELQSKNVDTIAFNNLSISDLSKYRDIKYMTVQSYFEDKDDFGYKVEGFIPKYATKDDIVIMFSKTDFEEAEVTLIKQFFKEAKTMEDKNDIFFYINEPINISYNDTKSLNTLLTDKFFIDIKNIKEVKNSNMEVMLSINNPKDDSNQTSLLNQILSLSKEFNIDKIQMCGSEIIGTPNNTDTFLNDFKENDISIITTEFQTSKGLNAYVDNGQENLIRGHEIPLNSLKLSQDEFSARIARAVKERNMRTIIVKDYIDYTNNATINSSIDNIIKYLEQSQQELSPKYTNGNAEKYLIMKEYSVLEIFVAMTSASLVALLILNIFNTSKIVNIVSIICAVIVFIGAMLANRLSSDIGIKLYAFIVGVVGACAAIIIPYKMNSKSSIFKFILTAVIATMTGLLIASIMYGTDYILKLRAFSGIKLLYILPPVLITLWAILDSNILKKAKITKENASQYKLNRENISKIISNIKWYHIAMAIIVIVGAVVYIRRSGNSGSAGELELKLRMMLEKLLYVRPRTKEFMLGYPAVILAYYMMKEKVNYVQYMLIPGSIATMSTANTFTHLHTPLAYSLLRTVYGVVLGLIVGCIYIFIFKQIRKFITKER